MDRVRLVSGDVIAAGQSVFRVQVESAQALSSGDEISEETARTETITMGQIRCAGCGALAPPNLTIVGPERGSPGETVEWWCALCRSEAAALPQPVPYYTTLRELGRGAMGVVYQARHNLTGQMVALKLIMPETATTRAAIDRFQREMSVISQLRHPNIVEWYEQGMTRGQFWFAMEYVAGTNLETLAKADPGRYPINQACRLTCQMLKGLEQAHQLGFVHRDIKPENILIAQTAEGLMRQDLRLRPGQELPRRGALGPDLLGRDARNRPVHAPRADARLQDGHSPRRPLRHGRHALLLLDLPVHVRRARAAAAT